jgi:hypothetical protein
MNCNNSHFYSDVELKCHGKTELIRAMLDSGASCSLISKHVVDLFNLPISQLPDPLTVRVLDGRSSSQLTHSSSLDCSIDNFSFRYDFNVMNGIPYGMILGIDFLQHIEPRLSWASRKISFDEIHHVSLNVIVTPMTDSRTSSETRDDIKYPVNPSSPRTQSLYRILEPSDVWTSTSSKNSV